MVYREQSLTALGCTERIVANPLREKGDASGELEV